MISPLSMKTYGFDPVSNTFQQQNIHWKPTVFYQRYPIRQRNGFNFVGGTPSSTQNLFRSLPLKIYRKELGGNGVGGSGAKAPSNVSIGALQEQPGGYTFSKTDPRMVDTTLHQNTVTDSKHIIDGGENCPSINGDIVVSYRTWDSECLCKNEGENKTHCLTTAKSETKMPYVNVIEKNVCFSTAGNALTRVRNRGAYNCGGGGGNPGYRVQYTSTRNVNSFVPYINNKKHSKIKENQVNDPKQNTPYKHF